MSPWRISCGLSKLLHSTPLHQNSRIPHMHISYSISNLLHPDTTNYNHMYSHRYQPLFYFLLFTTTRSTIHWLNPPPPPLPTHDQYFPCGSSSFRYLLDIITTILPKNSSGDNSYKIKYTHCQYIVSTVSLLLDPTQEKIRYIRQHISSTYEPSSFP